MITQWVWKWTLLDQDIYYKLTISDRFFPYYYYYYYSIKKMRNLQKKKLHYKLKITSDEIHIVLLSTWSTCTDNQWWCNLSPWWCSSQWWWPLSPCTLLLLNNRDPWSSTFQETTTVEADLHAPLAENRPDRSPEKPSAVWPFFGASASCFSPEEQPGATPSALTRARTLNLFASSVTPSKPRSPPTAADL